MKMIKKAEERKINVVAANPTINCEGVLIIVM